MLRVAFGIDLNPNKKHTLFVTTQAALLLKSWGVV